MPTVQPVNLYSPDEQALATQQQRAAQLAAFLQQQAFEPIQSSPNAPISWTQGAAKLAQALAAHAQQNRADKYGTQLQASQKANFDRMFPQAGAGPAPQDMAPQGQAGGTPSLTGNPEQDRMIAAQIGLPAYMEQVARQRQEPENFGQPQIVNGPDGKPKLVQFGNRGSQKDVAGASPNQSQIFNRLTLSDFDPASIAKFEQSGNPADLVRIWAPQVDTIAGVPTRTARQVGAPGSQPSTPSTQPLTTLEQEAAGQATIAGAKQAAQEAAQTAAVIPRATATQQAEQAANVRKNQVAWGVYSTGMQNLKQALQQTATGAVVGRIPAVTAAQQAAVGATADMAPIMKQMFRQAGEGTFTDADQRILMDMVPKRTDLPAARDAKIAMIDTLVKAKLALPPVTTPQTPAGVPSAASAPSATGAAQYRFNPQTGQLEAVSAGR